MKKELETMEVPNALILPDKNGLGGVVDDQGEFVWKSAFRHDDLTLWGGKYAVLDDEIEEIPEAVIYIGQMQKHWGNFLFDCMARIWYVLKEKREYRLAYCGVRLDENALSDPSTGYCDFIKLLGINPERLIDVRKPTKFYKVIIPELSLFPGTFYTDEFITVFDRAIETVNESVHINHYDKIYLTRRQMDACKELGEKEIEQIFKQNGFQIIAPEKLPIAEQIFLFNHCQTMASIEGTASHNILFAKPGTEQIILRKQNYINTRQTFFNRVRNVSPHYVDVFYEPFRGFPLSHDAGPFWIGVTASMKKWMDEQGYQLSGKEKINVIKAKMQNAIIYTLKCPYYKYWLKY